MSEPLSEAAGVLTANVASFSNAEDLIFVGKLRFN